MEQAWEGSLETLRLRDSGVEKWAARFLVRRQFRFITDGRTKGEGGRRGGEWREASASSEMILCMSTHPIMIGANASIHADSLKIWEQMMHRTTLSLFPWLSHWLAFSFSSYLSPVPVTPPFPCNFLPYHWLCVCEFAVQALSACPFLSHIFSIC